MNKEILERLEEIARQKRIGKYMELLPANLLALQVSSKRKIGKRNHRKLFVYPAKEPSNG